MGNELGFKTMPASSMVFTLTAADVTQGAFLPDADCKLRISHSFTVCARCIKQAYEHVCY